VERRLTIGLLGCGRIARAVHMRALRRMRDVEVAAIADPDAAARASASRWFPRARIHSDFRELLHHGRVDAVVVCLPSALHAEAAVAALRSGVHLYLEKPLATRLDEARGVLETARSSESVAVMGFNYRFNAHLESARRTVASGELGALALVRSVFATAPRALPDWKRQRAHGGGALLDLASHHVDLLPHLLGRSIRSVAARIWSERSEDDSAALELRLDGDLPVQSFFSTAAFDADRFEFHGTARSLRVDRLRPTTLRDRVFAPRRERSFELALARFVGAARAPGPQRGAAGASLADGLRSLEVVLAAEESARTGAATPIGSAVS